MTDIELGAKIVVVLIDLDPLNKVKNFVISVTSDEILSEVAKFNRTVVLADSLKVEIFRFDEFRHRPATATVSTKISQYGRRSDPYPIM